MKTCRKGLHQYDSALKQCPECHAVSTANWCKANPEKHAVSSAKWAKANPEKQAVRFANWRKANLEKHAVSTAKWRKNNPGKRNAMQAKRHAAKLQATPKWLTTEHYKEIQEFYTLAKELQWLANEPLHVDHIVPLQGENVSGLHVPWNLQILPESLNCSKSNRI